MSGHDSNAADAPVEDDATHLQRQQQREEEDDAASRALALQLSENEETGSGGPGFGFTWGPGVTPAAASAFGGSGAGGVAGLPEMERQDPDGGASNGGADESVTDSDMWQGFSFGGVPGEKVTGADDNDDDAAAAAETDASAPAPAPAPARRRKWHGRRDLCSAGAAYSPMSPFSGLGNQGATCYLNSLLQMLFMTPNFRRRVLEWFRYDEKVDGDTKECILLQC